MTSDEPFALTDVAADPNTSEGLAQLLVHARQHNRVAPPLGDAAVPPSVTAAEHVDDRVSALLGQPVVGWKIGCTSKLAQELLGADGPFPGRIHDRYVSGTTLPTLAGKIYVEGEIVFRFGQAIRASSAPERTDVFAAIDATWPAIELVGGHFGDLFGVPLNLVIADAGSNRGIIVPDPDVVTPIDPVTTKDLSLVMVVDGVTTGSGTGRDIMGDPVDALTWLVQRLAHRGIDVEAGQLVTVGTATGAAALEPGATAQLTIDGLGQVEISRPQPT